MAGALPEKAPKGLGAELAQTRKALGEEQASLAAAEKEVCVC